MKSRSVNNLVVDAVTILSASAHSLRLLLVNRAAKSLQKTINDSKFVTDLKATTAAAVAATKAGLEKVRYLFLDTL